MTPAGVVPNMTGAGGGDLATVLQQAVQALGKVIEAKPATDRILAEMVRLSGAALQAGGAGVWVTENPDKPELILEHQLGGLQLLAEGAAIAGVVTGVRRCAREGKPLIVPAFYVESEGVDSPMNPSAMELLFVPMRLHGKAAMVLMMAVPPPPVSDGTLHRTFLNFLARMVGAVEQTLTERHLSLMEKDRGTSNKLVRFTDEIHKHLFLGQVTVDIANLSRDVLEAERVTVEAYPRVRKRVLAVSNVDEPNKRANLFQVQRLIFDYVRDRHVPVALDRGAVKQLVSDPDLQDAATAYFAASGFEAFLAAPIKGDAPTDPVLGVIFVEYSTTEAAQEHQALLAEVSRLSVASVTNAIEVESVPLMKAFHAVRDLWRKPASPKRTVGLIVGGAIAIAIAIIGVIPMDFSIKADCQVRPTAQLPIVAPLDGRIVDIPVRAGEHVYPRSMQAEKGDLVKPLAVFDDTELLTEHAKVVSDYRQKQSDLQVAEQKGDAAKVQSLHQDMDQIASEAKQLEHEIDLCTVYSPIDGTVLTENVEQKQWSTPKKGEPLMEVASFSDWELVVDVPESEVATVQGALEKASRQAAAENKPDPGIEVEYILYPWPDERYEVHAIGTATLLPASTQDKNANVFRLQVKLKKDNLPPGIAMSGVTGRAKIHVGHKPLATQWTRGAMRLLKMTLFF
jgi:hypothetical protein